MNQTDMALFMRELLPRTWFPDESPIIDAILFATAGVMVRSFNLIEFVRLQGRLATASGVWLDMASHDYLGDRLLRRIDETDAAFRIRILREILRPKVTRQALSDNLYDLTGHRPIIFEPARAEDTGGWNTPAFALNVSGGWGSRRMPYQCFVTAFRTIGGGPGNISGFDDSEGSWGPGEFALQSAKTLELYVSDRDIQEAITSTISANTVVWMVIRPPAEAITAEQAAALDINFQLDVSRLD